MADPAPNGAIEIPNGYRFTSEDLATLLLRKYYPERTTDESKVIRDFLMARGREYSAYEFSVRVGQGVEPDPDHLPGVQATTKFSTQKRIDMIVWRRDQPVIVEVKIRIQHGTVGQLRMYRHLLLEDRPAIKEPELLAVGRYMDRDTERFMAAEGIPVLLYDWPEPMGNT